ncbi:MAG: phosphatase PAP2-related protein [Ferruginibacter sp.]
MVEEQVIYPYYRTSSWSEAWTSKVFRRKAIGAGILFIAMMVLLPHFFSIIEARQGIVLNDWVLVRIPPRDFSITIFIFLWSSSLLVIIRCIQQPAIFLITIYVIIAITLTRIITISLFPLDPPPGLIHIKDPLTSLSYGGSQVFMTKDLFFSGHTANLFLIYLCLEKKRDKQFALLAAITVGILVLVQHVHYTIDVIAAIVFAYCVVKLARRLSFLKV